MNNKSLRIAASSSNVPQNNLSSRSRFGGRGISFSQQELNKKDVYKDELQKGGETFSNPFFYTTHGLTAMALAPPGRGTLV